MTDISHEMGEDLQLSPSGDLAFVEGANLSRQRVIRRLLTNPGDYIYHVEYGGGIRRFIGSPVAPDRIRGVILRQMRLEQGVGPVPPPTVDVMADHNGFVQALVRYADQDSNPVNLEINR